MYDQARRVVADRRQDVNAAQHQVSTGRKIDRVSDDPQAARRTMRAEALLRDIEANRTSLDQGEHLLSVAEATLTSAGDILQRVSEMTVQFASDTYNTDDRAQAAEELVLIREQLMDLANAQDNGRYLFGGLGNAAPPFDATGAFIGDTGHLELPVGRGTRVDATLPGGTPFTAAAPAAPTIFGTLDALETALRADNGPAVAAVSDEVRTYQEQVRQAQQTIGHQYGRIEYVREALDQVELTAVGTLERDRDADLAEAILQLRQAEGGLQGALQVTARLDSLNLMNFL